MKTKPAFLFWAGLGLLTILNLLVFDYLILTGPADLRVQFTPDDAYYYLQLAKNFAQHGYWSFDSGVSRASGFHPLLAYILAALYKILKPSTEQFVSITILLSAVPTALLVIAIWTRSITWQNHNSLAALCLFVGAQSFLFNSVSGVEWSLVVLLAALYCYLFHRSDASWLAGFKLFSAGLFLSLARSDAGLLPLTIFAAALYFAILRPPARDVSLRNSLVGLAGACSGVLLVLLNNQLFAGSLLPSSARMKLYWSGFQDHLLGRSLILAARTAGLDLYLFPFSASSLSVLFFLVMLGILLFFLRVRRSIGSSMAVPQLRNRSVLYIASHMCIVAYLVLYVAGGAGLQNWYTANFLVPMFILFAGTLELLSASSINRRLLQAALALTVLLTVLLNLRSVYPVAGNAPWPQQQAMLKAGRHLKQNPLEGRIASWNAGIIGYYQGGQIINIDGLVNESIYPYAAENTLPVYLEQENIRYVVDFQTMLFPVYRQRGGYDDPAFLQRLIPLTQFDDGQFGEWRYLTLYRIRE